VICKTEIKQLIMWTILILL